MIEIYVRSAIRLDACEREQEEMSVTVGLLACLQGSGVAAATNRGGKPRRSKMELSYGSVTFGCLCNCQVEIPSRWLDV